MDAYDAFFESWERLDLSIDLEKHSNEVLRFMLTMARSLETLSVTAQESLDLVEHYLAGSVTLVELEQACERCWASIRGHQLTSATPQELATRATICLVSLGRESISHSLYLFADFYGGQVGTMRFLAKHFGNPLGSKTSLRVHSIQQP